MVVKTRSDREHGLGPKPAALVPQNITTANESWGVHNVNTSVLRNNVALGPSPTRNLMGTSASSNSWDLPVTVTEADFQTVSIVGIGGPRQADGSLPVLGFMKLAPGSYLIDKGVKVDDVTTSFNGAAPDLGAFESGGSNGGASNAGAGGAAVSGNAGVGGAAGSAPAAGVGGTSTAGVAGASESGGAAEAGGTPSSNPAGAANVADSANGLAGTSSGSPASAGAPAGVPISPGDADSGCSCRTSGDPAANYPSALLAAVSLAACLRRRRAKRVTSFVQRR